MEHTEQKPEPSLKDTRTLATNTEPPQPSHDKTKTTAPVTHSGATKVKKGDVSGAFLQGRISYSTLLHSMQGDHRRYGSLLQTGLFMPRLSGTGASKFGTGEIMVGSGELRGMIAGHVDDSMFTGHPDDKDWQTIESKIQSHYKWGTWETGKFVHCGVTIEEPPSGGYALSQPHYLDKISELNLNATRGREKNLPATEFEKTKLRGILGALSWHAQQVVPHLSAEVGLPLPEVSQSRVETVFKVNHVLRKAKARTDHKLLIHGFLRKRRLECLCGQTPQVRTDQTRKTPKEFF